MTGKITSKQLPGAKARIAQIKNDLASAPKPAPPSTRPVQPTPSATKPAPIEKRAAAPPPKKSPSDAPAVKPTDAKPAAPPIPATAPESSARRYSVAHGLSVLGGAFAAFINSICQGFKFVFILPYLLGTAALVWRRPPGIQVAFLSVLGAVHIAILMGLEVFSGYIAHRHVIPLVALAMPFVALGLWQSGSLVARLLRTRPAYCAAAALGISCTVVMPYTLRQLNREFLPVIEAVRWIQSRAEPGSGIVCNSPYVGFYGTLPVAELGPGAPTLAAALAEAPAGARYDYAVLHVGAHAYRPEWVGQLEPSYRPVLELPVLYPTGRPGKVVVFQARDRRVRHAARQPR